jgi:hypothetical protein
MKYTAKEIKNWDADVGPNWIPARPINYQYESWLSRIKNAWLVLTGRCDALDWEEGVTAPACPRCAERDSIRDRFDEESA